MFWISSQIYVGLGAQLPWAVWRQQAEGWTLWRFTKLPGVFLHWVSYSDDRRTVMATGRKEQDIWWQLSAFHNCRWLQQEFSCLQQSSPHTLPHTLPQLLLIFPVARFSAQDWRIFWETSQTHCQEPSINCSQATVTVSNWALIVFHAICPV